MAEFISKSEPEYTIRLTLDEAKFISWIRDEINNYHYSRYTEHAQNMALSIGNALNEHVPIYDLPDYYLSA